MVDTKCHHKNRTVHALDRCRACYDKFLRKTNPEYAAKVQTYQKEYRIKNKERLAAYDKERSAQRHLDPEYRKQRRNSMLKHKYKIDEGTYQTMLAAQNGACNLCFNPPSKTPLHVDHDHKTGRVRGLLCHQCNWYLGKIDKDQEILTRIANYRREPTCQED